MKNLFLIITLWFCALSVGSGQAFVQLSNATGYEYTSAEVDSLEAAAQRLINLYSDSSIAQNFKILHFGFYSLNEKMNGSSASIWDKAISDANQESRWYILYGFEYGSNGIINKYVEIKLPDPDFCLQEKNFEEIKLNLIYQAKGSNISELSASICSSLNELNDQLQVRFDCCHNRDECPLSFVSPSSIISELYEYGYLAYPITLVSPPTIVGGGSTINRSSCDVVNNSSTKFNIGTINECNIQERVCAFVSGFSNTTSKFYISDNNSYTNTFKQVLEDFSNPNNDYDFAAHFHIYDSADEDKIPDLILYYDYSSSDIQWCDDISTFDNKAIYTPFNFAGKLPIVPGDKVPDYPNLTWTDWDFYYGDEYLIKTQAFANIKGIPENDIHIYAFDQNFSLLGLFLDFNNPFDSNYSGGDRYIQSVLTYEENDVSKITAYSNKDVRQTTFNPSTSFVIDEYNKYITVESQGVYDDLLYTDEGKPIIDAKALEFRFGTYDENGKPYALLGVKYNLLEWARKALSKSPNKGIVSTNVGKQIYKIVLNGEIYIGRTKLELLKAMFRHSKGFEKWAQPPWNFEIKEYNIDQLFKQSNTIISNILDPVAWKGLEELMIQGYKTLYKEFGTGLNKIHGCNPKKKEKYKQKILAAKKWIDDLEDVSIKEGFELDFGKTIDELVEEIFTKYNIQ